MNTSLKIKQKILKKIEEYQRIIICRHKRPDGDAVGSTMGLKEIIKASYPEKEVLLINSDYSDYLEFLGHEDEPISKELYSDSLLIVIDTGNLERISNPDYSLAKEIIKIDHHIEISQYGDISWVEDHRSSACEMIVDFYNTFKDTLHLSKKAAKALYTGMVTDSGRFKFNSTSGETLRLAAVLLDAGVNTDKLFANLYLEEFDYLKFKAYVYENMSITENGVAYLYVDKQMQEKFNLSGEQASASVSFLDSIKGSIIWLAFIDNPDGSIRVRLRSRFVEINKIAEKYHGGGHAMASGATVYSEEERLALLSDVDALIKDYKENNEGWL